IALFVALGVGCSEVGVDLRFERSENEIIFAPERQIVPYPIDLVRDHERGRMDLPAPCFEMSSFLGDFRRELNKLDGFGIHGMPVKFYTTSRPEPDTFEGSMTVLCRDSHDS